MPESTFNLSFLEKEIKNDYKYEGVGGRGNKNFEG